MMKEVCGSSRCLQKTELIQLGYKEKQKENQGLKAAERPKSLLKRRVTRINQSLWKRVLVEEKRTKNLMLNIFF